MIKAKISKTNYTTEIVAGNHHMTSDEPLEAGGADAGPTPVQYLESALASCACITMRMYAERKGWPLEEVTVTMDHDSVNENRENVFVKSVDVKGDLDEQQVQRLIDIGGRCPVVRLISGSIRVVMRE